MQCGISNITKKRMSFETGLSIHSIDTLLIRFVELGKIKYNEQTNEIAIKNWRKYNPDSSPTVKKCIDNELAMVKDAVLIQYLYPILIREEKRIEYNRKEERESAHAPPISFEFLLGEVSSNCQQEKFSRFIPQELAVKLSHIIKNNGFKKATGKDVIDWPSQIYLLMEKELEFSK